MEHKIFSWGASWGKNCFSEGANIKKIIKNDWFCHVFLLTGVGGGQSLQLGEMPPPPIFSLLCDHWEWVTFPWKIGMCMGLLSNSQQHIPAQTKSEYPPPGHYALIWSLRFARRTNLGRLNDTLSLIPMRQLFHPSVLPILQHARDLTTVVVTMQRLVLYRRRSRPSCKSN